MQIHCSVFAIHVYKNPSAWIIINQFEIHKNYHTSKMTKMALPYASLQAD